MLGRRPNKISSSQQRKKTYIQLDEEEEIVVRLERRRWSRRHGLGLTVAGGQGSHPYRDQEPGIFVAKIVPGGAADAAGLKLDDEIISINGVACTDLDHFQAVELLRHSEGDLKVRVRRRVPRLIQTAVPTARQLGPLIRSRSSIQLNSSHRENHDKDPDFSHRRRNSSYRLDEYFDYTPTGSNGYLKPRSPLLQRSSSSYMSEHDSIPLHSNATILQHTHIDSTGVHFHPYCFACNPSVIHLNQPALQPLNSYQTSSVSPLNVRQHTYAVPSTDSEYPSPVQFRSRRNESRSSMVESYGNQKENGFKSQTVTVCLRRDDENGLGFVVSSYDRSTNVEGVYISAIVRGGIADRSGELLVGDRIISINGLNVERVSHKDIVDLLSRSKPYVQLEIERDLPPPCSSSSDTSDDQTSQYQIKDQLNLKQSSFSETSPLVAAEPPNRYQHNLGEREKFYPVKSSMKSSTSQSRFNDSHRPQPPTSPQSMSPPPPLFPQTSTHMENTNFLPIQQTLNDSDFPPPPTEIGTFRETLTKQTLTEQVVVRETSNTPGRTPVIIEDVIIHKDLSERLGLRIAGGKDSSCIPFGTSEEPTGVFISRVLPRGVAERTNRLRIGDRILKINGRSVADWTHTQVIRALTEPTQQTILTVRHDPPPEGLNELTIHRQEDEQLGIKVIGGLREPCSYEGKVYDSGIFISKIHRGGAIARDGRLKVGMRLLEVNGTNVVGVSRREAVEALGKAGHVLRLIVCDGWNNNRSRISKVYDRSSQAEDVLSNRSSVHSYNSDADRSVGGSVRIGPIFVDDDDWRMISNSKSSSSETSNTKQKFFDFKMSEIFESKNFPKRPPSESDGSRKTTTILMSKNVTANPNNSEVS